MTLKMVTTAFVLLHPTLAGVSLPSAELAKVPGLIEDASVLIEGYLERSYPDPPANPTDPNPVPEPARIVCRRAVARAVVTPDADPRFDSYASAMGSMSHTKHVRQDVMGGGVWLTRQDKMILDGIGSADRIVHVSMQPERSCPPVPPGRWWEMRPA
ncbi:hypothetical protein [Mycobacterium gordonae]|uniref:Uncharacterized protein n=1 Tax=Mycobacterium gordonae TaxID=1778 RepID=A0A1X1VL70_MYCGO|nr:hypothetical protein [Mycobacterium gordonae]MCV7010354.1 hypothetical protein [Mycobacterium gordonae]ODR17169.1 hypothetical protein BHQ23_27360 [Mycobacterium gordonae]ORV69870.1 hypothetical protein AWC08_06065 [Mycobacterium gordonae]